MTPSVRCVISLLIITTDRHLSTRLYLPPDCRETHHLLFSCSKTGTNSQLLLISPSAPFPNYLIMQPLLLFAILDWSGKTIDLSRNSFNVKISCVTLYDTIVIAFRAMNQFKILLVRFVALSALSVCLRTEITLGKAWIRRKSKKWNCTDKNKDWSLKCERKMNEKFHFNWRIFRILNVG